MPPKTPVISSKKPLILAHRGSMRLFPQNTMKAFIHAWELGVDGIELDVQCTKDEIPIVFHDDRLDALTNGTGAVKDYTFEEIRTLDAGSHFSPEFSGEIIPSLSEVLVARPKGTWVNIELKTEMEIIPFFKKIRMPWKKYKPLTRNPESSREIDARRTARLTAQTLAELSTHIPDLLCFIIVSSFDPIALEAFSKEMPEIPIGFLYYIEIKHDTRPLMKDIRHDSIHSAVLETKKSTITNAYKQGKSVIPWTVNSKRYAKRLFKWGVTGIITNYPETMLELRDKLQEIKN